MHACVIGVGLIELQALGCSGILIITYVYKYYARASTIHMQVLGRFGFLLAIYLITSYAIHTSSDAPLHVSALRRGNLLRVAFSSCATVLAPPSLPGLASPRS